jgi:hypothetical protein
MMLNSPSARCAHAWFSTLEIDEHIRSPVEELIEQRINDRDDRIWHRCLLLAALKEFGGNASGARLSDASYACDSLPREGLRRHRRTAARLGRRLTGPSAIGRPGG